MGRDDRGKSAQAELPRGQEAMLAIDDEVAASVVPFDDHQRGEEPDPLDGVDEPLDVRLARLPLVGDDVEAGDRQDGEGEIAPFRRVLEREVRL